MNVAYCHSEFDRNFTALSLTIDIVPGVDKKAECDQVYEEKLLKEEPAEV